MFIIIDYLDIEKPVVATMITDILLNTDIEKEQKKILADKIAVQIRNKINFSSDAIKDVKVNDMIIHTLYHSSEVGKRNIRCALGLEEIQGNSHSRILKSKSFADLVIQRRKEDSSVRSRSNSI